MMVVRALAAVLAALAAAASGRGVEEDMPSSGREIRAALQSLQEQYGADAVAMQGHLMTQAVASGSIGETSVGITGTEERGGKRYLAYRLETGIVYNDRDLDAAARLTHVWRSIVEPVLVRFDRLTLPADGVALHISYHHANYADRQNARDQLHTGSVPHETASFHALTADIVDIANRRISPLELVGRVHADVDGTPVEVRLPPEAAQIHTPVPTPPPHGED